MSWILAPFFVLGRALFGGSARIRTTRRGAFALVAVFALAAAAVLFSPPPAAAFFDFFWWMR
jgi:hypothetical protein